MRWPTPLTPIIISKLIGGSGGSVTPASIVTATGQMTAQQAADTLDNIGGEPQKFIITVTYDDQNDEYTADKSDLDAEEALSDGKTIEVVYDDSCYTFSEFDGTNWAFYNVNYDETNKVCTIKMLKCIDGDWAFSSTVYSPAPTTVTDLSSTSITLASAADNTIYEYGTLSALTVTAITNPGEFIISWRSGSTPTTHNLPSSMRFPTADNAMEACEANTDYEINCRNGKCVVTAWPVVSP